MTTIETSRADVAETPWVVVQYDESAQGLATIASFYYAADASDYLGALTDGRIQSLAHNPDSGKAPEVLYVGGES